MSLTESAGAAYATSGTDAASSASFTPTAGSLIVAIAANGNGNQITGTGFTISDTFGGTASGAWTTLVAYVGSGGSGLAGVWVKDAGASPSAGVVTVTAAPSTCLDTVLIVRQFAGAKAAASQNGKTGTATGTIATISITPNATGSQIVGAYGNGNNVTGIDASGTTGYGNTNGASGSSEGCFEGTSLTTAGTAQTLGVTVAQAAMAIAAAEILAATGTSVSSSDSGSGAESVPVIYAALSDAGSGSETSSANAALSSTDSGTGSDVTAIYVTSSDAGSGAESAPVIYISLSDAGSGTETASANATLSSTDTGTGAESQAVAGTSFKNDTDTGTGVETGSVAAALSSADAGTGAETQGLALSSTDSGTGAETQILSVAAADAGTGAETQGLGVALADGGTGAEAVLFIGVSSADAGTGTDAGFLPGGSVAKADSDAGRGQEGDREAYAGSDAAAGQENGSLLAQVPDVEVATGTESWATAGLKADTDAGTGTDAGQLTQIAMVSADAGTGVDASGPFPVADTEVATGADTYPYLDVAPFPLPWEFAPGGGVYKLIWCPGGGAALIAHLGEDRQQTVREWHRAEEHLLAYAAVFAGSVSHRTVADDDGGAGAEWHRPTATITQEACEVGS